MPHFRGKNCWISKETVGGQACGKTRFIKGNRWGLCPAVSYSRHKRFQTKSFKIYLFQVRLLATVLSWTCQSQDPANANDQTEGTAIAATEARAPLVDVARLPRVGRRSRPGCLPLPQLAPPRGHTPTRAMHRFQIKKTITSKTKMMVSK